MRILHIDIEAAPIVACAWGLFNQNLSINHIVEPGYALCFAAKWEGEPNSNIIFRSVHEHGAEEMVKTAYDLICKADALCTYNGKRYDLPTLNREFLLHGMKPPSPVRHIDLLDTARKQFKLASNKLDFMAQVLGVGAKTEHKGMSLWRDCMNGCDKAWKIMRKYNINDVIIMQKVYHKLRPWIKIHPNHALFTESKKPVCPNCGSTSLQYRGYAHTHTMTYHRLQCNDCGKWSRERTNCLTKEKKATILSHVSD